MGAFFRMGADADRPDRIQYRRLTFRRALAVLG
jgi:hypothetical protein